MTEIDAMKERYEKRKGASPVYGDNYSRRIVDERNGVYTVVLNRFVKNIPNARFLEIGAGAGGNLDFFKQAGFKPDNIHANELLEDRVQSLRKNHPDIHVIPGDALSIPDDHSFDIVFQSTVFTSILDDAFRMKLARKMMDLLKPGGIVLWYDFTFDNPKNPDVRKVTRTELRKLFPDGEFVFERRVTLAPPIGRRMGSLYGFFNLFPFLRSHHIAVIRKK